MVGSSPRRSLASPLHRRRVWTVLLAAALLTGGCTGPSERGDVDVARLVDGDEVDVAVGDSWAPVQPGDLIPDGARIRAGDGDSTHLALRSGELRLAPGAAAVLSDDDVELLRGEALIVNEGNLVARWDDVVVSGEAAYRLVLGMAPRLGVYRGRVDVARSTEQRRVRALREIALSTRRLPASQAPLSYRHDDPWDRLYLAEAIAFDEEVRHLTDGLAKEYGTQPRPMEFYEPFVPGDDAIPIIGRAVGADENTDLVGPPAEALLGLFVARSAADQPTPEALAAAAEQVSQLRSAGAWWGLIAVDLGVTPSELTEAVDEGQARYLAERQPAPQPSPEPRPQQAEPDGAPGPGAAPGSGPGPDGGGTAPPPPAPARQSQPRSQPPSGGGGGGSSPESTPEPGDGPDEQPRKGLVETVVDTLLDG